MSAVLLGSLAGLALLDSTSIGTLFIPVWLLLTPVRLRVGRIVVYLLTIAAFYFLIGLAVVAGVASFGDELGDLIDSRVGLWIQLVLGVGMFVLSFRFDPKRRKEKGGGAVGRWRERAMSGASSAMVLAGVAVLAGLAELVMMLPYLGAIAMMTAAELSFAATALLLAGYCLLMIAPAAVLLGARIVAEGKIMPVLERLNRWVSTKGAGATGWLLAIAGFLVARDAAARLWFPHLMGS
ncbi:GAP family protein [Kribbella sp. NPDC023855]|uniref:GAP family protein n=1 Tax=Kribbella sp. NPDC023855 TaxID=3154698 RepID=UPI0033FCDEFA